MRPISASSAFLVRQQLRLTGCDLKRVLGQPLLGNVIGVNADLGTIRGQQDLLAEGAVSNSDFTCGRLQARQPHVFRHLVYTFQQRMIRAQRAELREQVPGRVVAVSDGAIRPDLYDRAGVVVGQRGEPRENAADPLVSPFS